MDICFYNYNYNFFYWFQIKSKFIKNDTKNIATYIGNIISSQSTPNDSFLKHFLRPSRGRQLNLEENFKYFDGFLYICVNNDISRIG